ncbi:MAG TPA: SDR family NAD(P)-dependent oxidoreductase [Zeimonas sp.]
MQFGNRCVMITGASGALGRHLASAFAEEGARLVLVAREEAALRAAFGAAGGIGGRRCLVGVDLRDAVQAEAAAKAAIAAFGAIDVLCNLAGAFRMGTQVHETDDADWDFLFDANVRTLRNACRAVVPHMLAAGGGHIVNVGAYAARRGAARMGAYVAAKAAVERITETMSAELRERNVNVNCVLPSVLDTPQNRAAMPGADPARWVGLADLAHVIVFLASGRARAVHGASIPVTGLS